MSREQLMEELLCDKMMEISQLRKALTTAYNLVVKHHNCNIVKIAGALCPVCHREDGTEPELEEIAKSLL